MIIVFYLILSVLLLWFIIGCKGLWLLKFLSIGLSLALCLYVNSTINKKLGYPVEYSPKGKFEICWVQISEPDIFILSKTDRLRLLQIPYSTKLHEKMQEVQKMLKGGKRVQGSLDGEEGDGDGKGKSGKKGKKGPKGNSGQSWKGHEDFIFHELPPPIYPEKQ
mgnify:CR=1 FL=1